MQVSKLVQSLQLLPHPEGGFYKETFRDHSVQLSTSVLPHQYKVDRPVLEINEEGHVKHTILGPNLEAGQVLQHTVPPLVWFGAYPTKDVELVKDCGCAIVKVAEAKDPEHHFSLVGCTVAPAFQFADSEMAKRSILCVQFPHVKDCIEFLTSADDE